MLGDDVLRRPRALRASSTRRSAMFAHVNALQRDMCPSATRFEGEIIAMALDLMHADAVRTTGRRRAGHQRRAAAASCTPCSPIASRRRRRQPHRPTSSSRRPATRRSTRPATCSASSCAWCRSIPTRRWSTSLEMAGDRRQHDRDHRLGLQLRLRHDRPDRRARRARARARRRAARRRLPRRLHPAVRRGARLRRPAVRLPRPRRHHDLGRHPQVRLLAQGHLDRCCSATRRCATGSTSTRSTGAAASTCRRASTARAPAGCWRRRGRRW